MENNIKCKLKTKKILCIALVFIMLAINTVFFVNAINKSNSETDAYSSYVLDNFMRQHNSELSNIENIAFSILYSTMIDKLIENTDYGSSESELIQMVINSIENNNQNSLISNTYIFVNKKDICISNNGLYRLEQIYNQRFRKYYDTYAQWEDAFLKGKVKEYKYIKSQDDNNKLFFIHNYVSKKLERPAVIVIDINIDKFNAVLQKNLNSQGENIYILNQYGDTVFYTCYNDAIDFSKQEEGTQSSGNRKLLVKSIYSDKNIWQYIHTMPKATNVNLNSAFCAFYILILIIGILMMKVISKKVSCVNSDLNDDGAKEANVVSELSPMTNAADNAFSETLSGGRTVKIISYIEEHYSDHELTVKSIADEFGITANYLSAYFKKQTGASLSDYITKYRIEKSKELLKENLLIKEVAYHSGFNDANVYNRAFKKIEGITPRQYKLKN